MKPGTQDQGDEVTKSRSTTKVAALNAPAPLRPGRNSRKPTSTASIKAKSGPAKADRGAAAPADPTVKESEVLVHKIYQTVFDSVMGRRLPPGTKLPEAAMCALFGVGRTTVQKALQKLAHDHIVEMRSNRSAIVAMPTPEETRQIFEARRALETVIVSIVVKNASKTDIATLRQQLKEEHDAMHNYAQTDWARLASSFHLRVAVLSRNPILQRYLQELLSRSALIVALHEPAGHAMCEHDEHTQIVDAIEKGDAAKAVAAMQKHLLVLEQRIHLTTQKSENNLAHMLGVT